jgi:hypothetical protein
MLPTYTPSFAIASPHGARYAEQKISFWHAFEICPAEFCTPTLRPSGQTQKFSV